MVHPPDNPELMAELVGYHLGLADEESRARVEAWFGDAQALQAACAAVERVLSPLDDDAVEAPPPDLVDGILRRIQQSQQTIPIKPAAVGQASPALATRRFPGARTGDRARGGGPLLSLRELVGLAAAIALFVGIFVPGYRTARSAAQRAACMNNLRLIGNGHVSYAEMFNNQWPYAGPVPEDGSWLRTDRVGVPRIQNSRHVFRLLGGRFVAPQAFVCPGRPGDVALDSHSLDRLDDFPDPRNNSYATNFVTRPWSKNEFEATMPLAADMTPLLDDTRRLTLNVEPCANSRSHGRPGGQNVLRANISVKWFARPNVGIDHDDIYRLIGVKRYTGLERPHQRTDAFLIP